MEEPGSIAIISLIAIFGSSFIIFTLLVILLDKKMREKPATVPIVSFLVAALTQGILAFPVYVYRKLSDKAKDSIVEGVCDIYRVPYFYCGHILTMSLFYVSLDRLFVITRPYVYQRVVNLRKFTWVIVICWFITGLIDMVPLFDIQNIEDGCHYNPGTAWGVTVIIIYIIIPLITIILSYSIIWWTAVRIQMKDNTMKVVHTTSVELQVGSQNSINSSSRFSNTLHIVEMKATKTSLVLIITYIVCWGPLGIFYMVDHFCNSCYSAKEHLTEFRTGIKILALMSSFLAPAVYCWWNKHFRESASKIFKKTFHFK